MLRRIKMSQRVALICLLFALPCLALLGLLVREKNLGIDFASDELAGARYFRALIPVRSLLQAEHPDAGEMESALDALSKAQASEINYVNAAEEGKAFVKALGGDASAALPPFRALAAKVGDNSKMILDPDLDSFYMMDMVVVHMPEDLDDLYHCRELAQKSRLSQIDIFTLNAKRDELAVSAAAFKRNLEVVYAQEAGAACKLRLAAPADAYLGALASLGLKLDQAVALGSAAGAREALKACEASAFSFWSASLGELSWLLERRRSSFRSGKASVISFSLLGIALALALAWAVAGSLTRPVQALSLHMQHVIESGDLRRLPDVDGQDEVSDLARALGQLMERMRRIPLELSKNAEVLSQAVAALEAAALSQNSTVTRQASALQETQVTAEEIKQTSQSASRAAQGILESTQQADELGRQGLTSVEQSLQAFADMRDQSADIAAKVGELGERTRQIGDITGTVKELADQSNMLALNAAIEAVRAGEHGKGFSLVAREIRRLADQSIQATNRVREILDSVSTATLNAVKQSERGQEGVKNGLNQAMASGATMKSLAAMLRDNNAAVRQIAAAVNQQNTGVSQVFMAVTDQSRMMDETVKELENTLKNIESLKDVSRSVISLVKSYQV